MIKPIVPEVPFRKNAWSLKDKTIREFKLSKKDEELSRGVGLHKTNHISKNIIMAGRIREQIYLQHLFKQSVLDRKNVQNLKLLKTNHEKLIEESRSEQLEKQVRWDKFKERRFEVV
jgi:hypothetical protein